LDLLRSTLLHLSPPAAPLFPSTTLFRSLDKIVGTRRHQGVIAFASQLSLARNLDELLDAVDGPPLLLILDGITDPHNLGACLRVADGVGAHAVIAPKDRSVGLNATAAKVASGAAETV